MTVIESVRKNIQRMETVGKDFQDLTHIISRHLTLGEDIHRFVNRHKMATNTEGETEATQNHELSADKAE